MENTTPSSIFSASDVNAIGDQIKTEIGTVGPAVLGVMGVLIVVGIVFKLVKKVKNA